MNLLNTRRNLTLLLAATLIGGMGLAATTLPASAFSVSVSGSEGHENEGQEGASHESGEDGEHGGECAVNKVCGEDD